MSPAEKRQIQSDVLNDSQEAAETLRILVAKAKRVSESFCDLATWLDNACKADRGFEPAQDFWSKDRTANIVGNGQRYREVTNYEEIITLVGRIMSAQKRVDELRERKQAIGCD